jgi:hypothetical protein
MPATFPSHAAAVLPLKLWRPRGFDGVALVIGSTAPDLAYPFAAIIWYPPVHSLPGLFWWCLPVGLLLTWVIRWAAPVVARHLPEGGPLALHDYGVLAQVHHPWRITVWSVLIGSGSHLLWDGFTHSPETNGWAVAHLPWLTTDAVAGIPWFRVLQHGSSIAGAVLAVAMLVHIGRRRLVRQWHGEAPPAPYDPRLFWSVSVAVVAAYPLTWPLLTHLYQPHVQGVRLLCFMGLGLVAGSAAVRLRRVAAQGRMGS